MKKVLLLILLGIAINTNAQKSKEDNNIYTTVETPPTFPNGYKVCVAALLSHHRQSKLSHFVEK